MIRFAIGLLALAFLAAPANAYPSWWRGKLPECESPQVLAKVQKKIAYGSPRVLGYHLAIEEIERIKETHVSLPKKGLIDRRYCTAKAWLSNGRKSEVVYLIEASQGFASIGYNVESCLPSYDRWRVYDGWCRSIRP